MAKIKNTANKRIFTLIAVILVTILVTVSGYLDKQGKWDKIYEESGVGVSASSEAVRDSAAYFLDVGQGDSTIFISEGKSMLIDAGEAEYAPAVEEKLRELNVDSLDYVVATHAHSDHIGGLSYIINTFGAENIIMTDPSENDITTSVYENFLDAAENSGANIIFAEQGYTFSFGNTECEILSPFNISLSEENNNSVVLKITQGETSFLMMGDAEEKIEKQLIKAYPDLKASILKTGHHGSDTSSSMEFLEAVSPEYAVISVGENNSYNHPSAETLNKFENLNINYFRTDKNGTVTVTFNKNGYKTNAEKQ